MKTNWIISLKIVFLLTLGLFLPFAHSQSVPLKIQICTKAAQIAGDIARYKIQAKSYEDAYGLIQTSSLPLAQTTRLQGLLKTVWSSAVDAQEARTKLNPTQIQNDYYLTCTQ